MKTALITGINGQDGSYLAEYLISIGYRVFGMVRRNSVSENQTARLNSIRDKIHIEYGDMTDMSSIINLLNISKPDEVYHLAAQSHVKISFCEPIYTTNVNAVGTLNLLEAVRLLCPGTKVYNAASSEMFGNEMDEDRQQSEATKMSPVSPYGISKLYAYNLTRNYRESYSMFLSSGILFNHESIRRAGNFVTTKVVKGAIDISRGKLDKLIIGNLEAQRDWGFAGDYVKAMHRILQHHTPDDFVISTGHSFSVRHLCDFVFSKLQMDYRDHVVSDVRYMRPKELDYLKGNAAKANKALGWIAETSFESMITDMITHWSTK